MQPITATPPAPAPATPPQPVAPPAAPPAGGDLLAPPGVSPDDSALVQRRIEAARRAELTADTLPRDVAAGAPPEYFRSYDELRTAMYGLAKRYPDLVEVQDVGDTVEGAAGFADRDVLALVLTSRGATGGTNAAHQLAGDSRPTALHVAGLHAREVANPEMLMTFATQLAEGYGRDPEATMLLDSRRVVLVPMVNPDGHVRVEGGWSGADGGDLMQRKNVADPSGVDVNRNFEHGWGGPGAGTFPRSETYRGPSPASEPETQAVQGLLDTFRPEVFVDWHSYGRLNMHPPGAGRTPTADDAGFRALVRRFSTFNGYSPIPSVDLYPTSGTTLDHAYGRHGSAAFAIETGDRFHQTDAQFAETLRGNLPVLQYTTRVADAPFARVHGPDAGDVVVHGGSGRVEAAVTDADSGAGIVTAAELVLDAGAEPGTGIALEALDGSFDAVGETVGGALPASLAQARDGQLVYVRGRDAEGNWGPLAAQWVTGPAR